MRDMKDMRIRPKNQFQKLALNFIGILPLLLLPINETGSFQQSDNGQKISSSSVIHRNNFSPTEVLVKFSPDYPREANNRTIRKSGGRTLDEIPDIGAFVLEVQEGEVGQTIEYLQQQENVIYVEPNYLAEMTDIIPNDPGWGNQYNLTAIHAPQGWMLNTGEVWVTIAILDSGVDLTHPDIFVRILPGYDFVNNDSAPQDDNGHGTHVAAIAAASSNNAVGISGVNWGANILPVKVLNASGNGTYANVAAGIVWATDHGAQVINLSLGGAASSFVLNDAVNYAYQNGVVLVASTGNAGIPAVLYPAAYEPVIAVGATDSTNAWAGFSNYGSEVDVVAPGVNIYSAFPGGGYGYRSGTSMSAPHVSGLAALLWGIPGNGPANIRNIIEATSLDLGDPGWDPYFGNGLIQMDSAILSALPPPTSTPTFTPTLTPTFTPTSTNAPAAQEGNNADLPSRSYFGFLPEGTFTPTATRTPEEPSNLSGDSNSEPDSGEIAVSAQDFPSSPENGKTGSDFQILPCLGISMILAGLIILFYISKGKYKGF